MKNKNKPLKKKTFVKIPKNYLNKMFKILYKRQKKLHTFIMIQKFFGKYWNIEAWKIVVLFLLRFLRDKTIPAYKKYVWISFVAFLLFFYLTIFFFLIITIGSGGVISVPFLSFLLISFCFSDDWRSLNKR